MTTDQQRPDHQRVVVTGMAGITSLGSQWQDIRAHMEAGRTGIRHMPEWDQYHELNTRLAGPIDDFDLKGKYPRKALRSMGRVSQLALDATDRAVASADLDPEMLKNGRCGISYGSSFGSTSPMMAFARLMQEGVSRGLTATSYVQMMSHTAAVNLGVFYGMTGRIIPTSTACTSGSMGIGYAVEAIRAGHQDLILAGGCEELCPTMAGVFDTLFATSQRNDAPDTSPRPYDKDRDGLVIGEGAATLVLESLEHAIKRGATPIVEVTGFGTNSDGAHITQPTAATMAIALKLALTDAGMDPAEIDFISGHGTATDAGDAAETAATFDIFQRATPIHSLKSYFGHTLGACGAIEAWLGIEMMRDSWFPPTANLDNIADDCAPLDYLHKEARTISVDRMMSNNFAFGGINTSLIFSKIAEAEQA